MKKVYVVCEYVEHGNEIIGIYETEEKANKVHQEQPTFRYVEKHYVE